MGLIDQFIDFLGVPWNARWSVIAANVWRGIPFVAICLLAGLQTISPSLYEAAALDGANSWQRFRYVTMPMLMPILAVVLTFSVLFTFTRFSADLRHHPRRATERDASDGDTCLPRAIPGGDWGRALPSQTAMIPFLIGSDAVQLLRFAAPKMATGRVKMTEAAGRPNIADSAGMSYLENLPGAS